MAIVPSGYLHYLPFAGLARPTASGAEFLVQRKEVAMLSKASDLALLGDTGKTRSSLVAFGNPDGTLPGAELEVEDLEGVFPGASVALRDKATESRLRQESGKAGYLHLATHGTLDSRNPNASYITMARDAGGDDRLHPRRYLNFPYPALVWSPCRPAQPLWDARIREAKSPAWQRRSGWPNWYANNSLPL